MKQRFGPVTLVVVLLLTALNAALFDLHETEQAVLVQLGRPVREDIGPGLHVKIPFIQQAVIFKRHLLAYEAPATTMLTADKKNLVVEAYAKWRIESALTFFETAGSFSAGLERIGDIVGSQLRTALGGVTMEAIVGPGRAGILAAVGARCDEQGRAMGVRIVDVRIRRLDLPTPNTLAVYERMRMEREARASTDRAVGQAEAERLRAEADRRRTVLLAEAYRRAQEIQGRGDAEASRIYAAAFGRDPEFYRLVSTYEAARRGLAEDTLMVLDGEYEILDFLKTSGVKSGRR